MVTDRKDDLTRRFVIETTKADENIHVQAAVAANLQAVVRVTVTDPQGTQTFQKEYPISDQFGNKSTFLIKSQGGNDRVTVDPNLSVNVQVDGGQGQDTLQGGTRRGWTITDFSEEYSSLPANFILDTSDGDDVITIRQDPNDIAKIQVTVNGLSRSFHLTDTITLRTGKGNDRVTIAEDVLTGIKLETGDGKDYVEAHNHRRNYIDTGSNNDTIISTGTGNSVFYGGSGKDTITAGDGDNYVDGGTGKDTINLGNGNNVASGGSGKDTITTGSGSNVIYTGSGKDSVDASTGTNTVYAQDKDNVQVGTTSQVTTVALDKNLATGRPLGAQAIKIEGDRAFRKRVKADLETLRNSPAGRQMLEALDNSGKTVTIREINERNGKATTDNKVATVLQKNGGVVQPGPTDNATIGYDPTYNPNADDVDYDPIIVLYHELSHAYNMVTGTLQPGQMKTGVDKGISNLERQAIGLPNDGLLHDFDGQSSTAPTTTNPEPLTENGLRKEQGRKLRQSYNWQFSPQPSPPSTVIPTQPNLRSEDQRVQRDGATTPTQLYTEAYQTIAQSHLAPNDAAMMDRYIAYGLASQGYDEATIAAAIAVGSPDLAQINEVEGATLASQALQDRLEFARSVTDPMHQAVDSPDFVLQ